MKGSVLAVSRSVAHTFTKTPCAAIRLVAGEGVEGDAHAGSTVKHRSRVAKDPSQPNLRQVHLIHAELHDELLAAGFVVHPGDLGENITLRGVPLLSLSVGTSLCFAQGAVVELTGLRNPCGQIEAFQKGLLSAVLEKDAQGSLMRKAGVMGVVRTGGDICPGDTVLVTQPTTHVPLAPV